VGYSDFREVSLPIKGATGRITLRKYLLGWYVYQLRVDITPVEQEALDTFRLEIHAEPIRQALATW
jgi:hypothetical protein